MKAKLKHFEEIKPFIKEKTFKNVLLKQKHTRPAEDDSLGKAVHVGTAGVCMKRSLFTMRRRKCLKIKYAQKYPDTLSHTNTQKIFLSLCSAAISLCYSGICTLIEISRSDCCPGLWSNHCPFLKLVSKPAPKPTLQ